MSEDFTNITFTASKLSEAKRKALSELVGRYAQEYAGDVTISNAGTSVSVDIEYCGLGFSEIEQLLLEVIDKFQACDVVCTSWFNKVGEKVFSSIFDGELQLFDSRKELDEYREESKQSKPLVLDYGRDRRNQTAIVRLQIKPKTKRKKVFELFATAVRIQSDEAYSRFAVGFNELVRSKTHDVEWCKFKWKDENYWYYGPDNLVYGLIFVLEDGEFVYLGFDVEDIEFDVHRPREEEFSNLVYILYSLDGVSKSWVKLRPGADTIRELYAYHPAFGGESALYKQSVTEDSDWPR